MVQIYSAEEVMPPFCRLRLRKRTGSHNWGYTNVKPQDFTPVSDVRRFRLRRGDRIVGWMREEPNGTRYYSREGLWWSGRQIKWDARDRCCGLQDVDDRWLHEGDLLQQVGGSWWESRYRWLVLCDAEHGWSFIRNSAIRGIVGLKPQDACAKKWRWSGVGWRT